MYNESMGAVDVLDEISYRYNKYIVDQKALVLK